MRAQKGGGGGGDAVLQRSHLGLCSLAGLHTLASTPPPHSRSLPAARLQHPQHPGVPRARRPALAHQDGATHRRLTVQGCHRAHGCVWRGGAACGWVTRVGGWVGGREGGEWLAASAALRPRVAQLAHPLPPAASHRLPACLEPHAVRIGQRLAARAGNDGLPRPLRQIRCGWLASSWLLWTRPIWCSPRRAAHCLPRQHACARIGAGRACNHQCCSRLAALASPPPRPPPRSKRSLAG